MAILKIYTYPESILKQKTKPVENIDGALQELIDNMYETIHYASGVGLAATQVGNKNSLFIVEIPSENEKARSLTIINPVIVEAEGSSSLEEGCLSLPGFRVEIKRNSRVVVKGYDRNGKDLMVEAKDLLATAIQHELDHLDGITLLDKTSFLKRQAYIRSIKKAKGSDLHRL